MSERLASPGSTTSGTLHTRRVPAKPKGGTTPRKSVEAECKRQGKAAVVAITEVASGSQSVNNSEGYGYGAYDTFTDTYFPGESRLQILVGRQGTTGESGIRFYFWASTVVDGETVTDFAPDNGWVTFRPTATQ